MRTNHTANKLQYLNQTYKLYDDDEECLDQCLLMPDMIIAMNDSS